MSNPPAANGFSMPPEWAPHERTWMAWPTANDTFSTPEGLERARVAWGRVAATVARYEPVTVVAAPGDAAGVTAYAGPEVAVAEHPLNDAWMRDIGPTFVTDGRGGVAGVDWVFNGWGAQEWASWDHDRHVARHVAAAAGVPVHGSPLVNEGGGIHVDGEGTVLVTETVQLDPGRNPGWTREGVEAELRARLGAEKVVWLPRGLTRDYDEFGTRGHVDIVAAFARPGLVMVHTQTDPAHPDHEVSREIARLLRGTADARGRSLEVVEIPAPTVTHDEDGRPVDWSYINHYVVNGAVVLCAFGDPRDADNAGTFARLFPGRAIELVDAREIFANGGGIHCITQQQPRA